MLLRTLLFATTLVALSPLTAQPINDPCSGAVPISCGGSYAGTTIDATEDAAPTCVTAVTAAGVWYVLEGATGQITLSVCSQFDYDTKLNVYVGGCGALACVAGNDDACALGSTVVFAASEGTSYLVLVQGYNGLTGTFTLGVSCAPLTNDVCAGAIPIACGDTLSGSTVSATADGAPDCGTSVSAPGVWYSFIGDGDQTTLSTCSNVSYDSKINVYSGTCDALICVVGNDDTPGAGTCSTVSFDTEAGVPYQVLVQGYNGATGSFDLVRSCQTCGTPTALDITPFDIAASFTWESSEAGAGYIVEYGPEGFTPGTGTILTGTQGIAGPPVLLTGLTLATNYEVYLTLDCGDGDLSQQVGPVGFATITEPLAPNALCVNAVPLTCDGSATGNTTLGLVADAPACGSANITTKGLWYSVEGNGQVLTVSTCSATDYDSKISVFTGDCNAPLCVAGNDDAAGCGGNSSQLSFPSMAGVTYLVLVHGYNQAVGTFTLSITCADGCETAGNDDCVNATELVIQPVGGCEASTGSNECAYPSSLPNPDCDPFASVVDVWYRFNSGFAPGLSILAEAITAEEVNVALYSGCTADTYIACWSEVSAPINIAGLPENTDFLLRVWNSGGAAAGTFSLCLEADINTSVATPTPPTIRLAPVPTQGPLRIEGAEGLRSVEVMDLQGRSHGRWSLAPGPMATIDVSRLATGTYLLRGENGVVIGRFMRAD
ncbi:MAG: T9SS type A sorting domain-containing protein [Flavobacteriales bacterium]